MVISMQRWVGKVAVVTGASSGIGAAIVDQLVANGLIVVGIARRVELVEERASKLSGKPGKLHPLKADFSKEEDILKAFKWIKDNVGSTIHILINNAGVGHKTSLVDGDTEMWKNVFDLNVLGLSIATREAVKVMRDNDINGHIVHVNSILGHQVVSYPGLNVYPASKYAVTALTETLRLELVSLGSKIKVTSVSPGFVDTEMTVGNKNISEEERQFLQTFPILQAEDIADGVIYVLSTPEHVQVQELTIRPVGEKF